MRRVPPFMPPRLWGVGQLEGHAPPRMLLVHHPAPRPPPLATCGTRALSARPNATHGMAQLST